MLANLLKFCQNVSSLLNLTELLKIMIVLALIITILLSIKIIVKTIQKESIIDERIRERRSRIAQISSEINYSVTAKTGQEQSPINLSLNTNEQGSDINSSSLEITPKKKTRAMSMEERWADFDKKRAAKNSA